MKEIRRLLPCFDINAFLARTIEFLKGQLSPGLDPTYGIVWVQSLGDVPVFGLESGWDVLSALNEEEKTVFFPFAYADADGTVTCADGNTFRRASDKEESEDETLIGLEDSMGYLVQVKGGTVIINSAIHTGGGCTGPAPRVDLCTVCGVLDGPMEKFIRGFIRE
jgi:hypothetical protein